MTMTVRTARKADLMHIDALFARSYPALLKDAYPPSLLVTVIPLIAKAQPALVATGTFYVVEEGNRIRGAGGWTSAPPPGRRAARGLAHVRHVVTDHREVRRGIGQALMAHIFDTARQAGQVRMECLSTLMAVPFYAACGFEEIGPLTIAFRPGIDFPTVLMARDL